MATIIRRSQGTIAKIAQWLDLLMNQETLEVRGDIQDSSCHSLDISECRHGGKILVMIQKLMFQESWSRFYFSTSL